MISKLPRIYVYFYSIQYPMKHGDTPVYHLYTHYYPKLKTNDLLDGEMTSITDNDMNFDWMCDEDYMQLRRLSYIRYKSKFSLYQYEDQV